MCSRELPPPQDAELQLFSERPEGHVASRTGARIARTSASTFSSCAVSGVAAEATLARTCPQRRTVSACRSHACHHHVMLS